MDVAISRAQRIKQGIILFAVLVGASIAGSILIYNNGRTSLIEQIKEELTTVGRLAALQVDPKIQAKIVAEGRTDSPLYQSQIKTLQKVAEQTRDIESFYTLRRVGRGIEYVTSSLGLPSDDSGVRLERPYLFQKLDASPSLVNRAFETGLPQIDQKVVDGSGGRWSVYVPIVGDFGETEFVLGLNMEAWRLEGRLNDLFDSFCWGLVVAVLFSLAVSIVYTISFLQYEGKPLSPKRSPFILRQAAEAILGIGAVACILSGIVCQSTMAAHRTSLEREVGYLKAVSDGRMVVSRILANEKHESASRSGTALLNSRSPWLGSDFVEKIDAFENNAPGSRENLAGLAVVMDREAMLSSTQIGQLNQEYSALNQAMDLTFLGAIVVGIGAFWLLRYRAKRDSALQDAVRVGQRAQSDLGQVVEHLPVGLFTAEEGKIAFSNPAWRSMMGLAEEAEQPSDFLAQIHPSDRKLVHKLLEVGGANPEATDLQFRVVLPQSKVRHVALKAVPIPSPESGNPQLLAFTLDITDNVEARHNLQTKGQEVELKNRMLAAALEDLEANLESVVRCLVRAVEAKDPYTAGHSERVMEYSLWIGEELGLGPYEMRVLELGTLVHDVGKIGIPDAILTKPGKLSDDEYAAIRCHPELGVRILEGIGLFHDCMPIVRWHHERLDGSGYPDKLTAEEIPFLVRIAAVADVFDAMTSTRAYRSGIEPTIVLKIIQDDAERGMLDVSVVDALGRAVKRKGVIPQSETPPSMRRAS